MIRRLRPHAAAASGSGASTARDDGSGPATARDDGMALFFVLLGFLVVSGLSIGLLGALFGELGPTIYERKSQRTIAGSQAGLQAGLAAVRQAWSSQSGSTLNGDRTRLPCYTSASPLVGQVGGLDSTTQNPVTYRIQVSYYTINPSGQSDTWRTANAIPCVPGAGTSVMPVYVLVQSVGASAVAALPNGKGDRSSEIVYALNRTDQGPPGGHIHSDLISSNTKNLCWEAASYPATAGTLVFLAACVTAKPAQLWSYRSDYSIVLTGSQTSTSPPSGGLCVNADSNGLGGGITGASLQPCGSGLWNQVWAYNDNGEFQTVNNPQNHFSHNCPTTNDVWAVGAQLTVGHCDVTEDNWTPDPAVGAGAAGALTQQLVNYVEYGRCLDITDWDLNTTWLIDYPCEQDPTSQIGWDQRWVWDSPNTREIQSNTSSGLYCLTAPATAGAYVVVRSCDNTRADQKWTMLGDTGNRTTAYTVVDGYGRCLGLGDPGPGRPDLSSWSSIIAQTCDGSYSQKWNASPLPTGANVTGERETTGGR